MVSRVRPGTFPPGRPRPPPVRWFSAHDSDMLPALDEIQVAADPVRLASVSKPSVSSLSQPLLPPVQPAQPDASPDIIEPSRPPPDHPERSESVNPRFSPAQGARLTPPFRVLNACTSQGNSLSRTDSIQPRPPRETSLKIGDAKL